jgi:hypothetical protein
MAEHHDQLSYYLDSAVVPRLRRGTIAYVLAFWSLGRYLDGYN